eukprot:3057305-Pleurochrysis_carterae.AAC.1
MRTIITAAACADPRLPTRLAVHALCDARALFRTRFRLSRPCAHTFTSARARTELPTCSLVDALHDARSGLSSHSAIQALACVCFSESVLLSARLRLLLTKGASQRSPAFASHK